jgi:16S rRNA (uracil1498-N3)-methyltransferase
MPYFLSTQNLSSGKIIEMSGEEARHVLFSHRAKIGEKIKVQGPDGKRYQAEIVEIGINRKSIKLKILGQVPVPEEPKVKIALFQSMVSEKALDFIFQKGTELGLYKIVLFNSANTATKLSADGFSRKQERWNKILVEAAKQCERAKWPSLEFVADVGQAIEKMKSLNIIILADIFGKPIKNLILDQSFKSFKSCSIIIGPEGGFTQQEIGQFKSLPNLQTISLGPILLRAETAALASLSIISQF